MVGPGQGGAWGRWADACRRPAAHEPMSAADYGWNPQRGSLDALFTDCHVSSNLV
jgi:hypothetical protein